jgi:hypothetical protein
MAASELLALVPESWRYSITPRSSAHAGGPDSSSASIKIFNAHAHIQLLKKHRRRKAAAPKLREGGAALFDHFVGPHH